jgi:alpha-mannosidase
VSCLKGAEDGNGLVLRAFNPGPVAAPLRVDGPVTVQQMRLDESGSEPVPAGVIDVRPQEIATLRLIPFMAS